MVNCCDAAFISMCACVLTSVPALLVVCDFMSVDCVFSVCQLNYSITVNCQLSGGMEVDPG